MFFFGQGVVLIDHVTVDFSGLASASGASTGGHGDLEAICEVRNETFECVFVRELARGHDVVEQACMTSREVFDELALEAQDVDDWDLVEVAASASDQTDDLLSNRHR